MRHYGSILKIICMGLGFLNFDLEVNLTACSDEIVILVLRNVYSNDKTSSQNDNIVVEKETRGSWSPLDANKMYLINFWTQCSHRPFQAWKNVTRRQIQMEIVLNASSYDPILLLVHVILLRKWQLEYFWEFANNWPNTLVSKSTKTHTPGGVNPFPDQKTNPNHNTNPNPEKPH